MKALIYTAIFLFTTLSFAQNTGMIVGKIMDNELKDSPLVLASISVKGSPTEVQTDLTGFFLIENLEAGNYTLVCNFVGYETKEVNVPVDALQPAEVNVSMAASQVSLLELASLVHTSKTEDQNTLASK